MTTGTTGTTEPTGENDALFIGDGDGNFYMIPRAELQRFLVSGEYADAVAQAMSGGEVSGYVHPLLKKVGSSLASASETWVAMSGYYIPEIAIQQASRSRDRKANA